MRAIQTLGAAVAAAAIGAVFAIGSAGSAHSAVSNVCSTPAPTSAAGYNAAFAALPKAQWGAADGDASAVMNDGRTVWTFGDTEDQGPARFVHSTIIVQTAGCFHVSNAGAQVVPNDSDGSFYWLGQPIIVPGSTAILAPATHVVAKAGGFTVVGTKLARISISAAGNATFDGFAAGFPTSATINWNAGHVVSGSILTIYGVQTGSLKTKFGDSLFSAKIALAKVTTGTWTVSTTALANDTDAGVSAVHDAAGFHLFTKQDGFLGKGNIVEESSSTATGPFSEKIVATTPAYGHVNADGTTGDTYNVQAHGVLPNGRTLLSYSNNCATLAGNILCPLADYRPTFIGVAE